MDRNARNVFQQHQRHVGRRMRATEEVEFFNVLTSPELLETTEALLPEYRSFAVRFLSEAPNFPFPAKTMRGGWEVTQSNVGSQVMVWWELTPKSKLLAPIVLPLLAFQADRDFPKIIQRMATAALGKTGEVQIHPNAGVLSRLLPSFC